MPESIGIAKGLTQEENFNWTEINEKYKFVEVGSIYAGIKQRWIVIESTQAKSRELKTLGRKIDKQEIDLQRLVKSKGSFSQEDMSSCSAEDTFSTS